MPLEPRTTDPMPNDAGPYSTLIFGVIFCLVIIILIILAFCFYCIKQNGSRKSKGCNDGGYTIEETFHIEDRSARRFSNNSTYGQIGNFFRNIPIRVSSRFSRSESRPDSRPDSLIEVNTQQN